MKSLFFCYDEKTTTSSRSHFLDKALAQSIIAFLTLVFFDWPYW